MIDKELLLDITNIPSPSGYEDELIHFIKKYTKHNFKNVKSMIDSGELYLVRETTLQNSRTILYDAHIDQVSCRILKITDDGFIIARCFGFNEKDIMGKNVRIINENGIIEGVITIVPPHLKIKNNTIYIDIF